MNEAQSAFIPGRCITDNVLIAFEIIHHMKQKNKGNVGEVTLKIDISKAYDRLCWDYLKIIMLKMGFAPKWVDWIMLCVSTVTCSISVNGKLVDPIKPKRGLRHGIPLSPYLFYVQRASLTLFPKQ